jgi:hypothetical protein
MRNIKKEQELYDYPFVIAGSHPGPHFRGYYHLLFDKLEKTQVVAYTKRFSETFWENYQGKIICLAPYFSRRLNRVSRKYQTVLVSHGPFPLGSRVSKPPVADYVITNGSEELLRQIDLSGVGNICTAGYFPTDYFLPERKPKTALVQITGKYQCRFTPRQVCLLLLNQGFEVSVHNHLLYWSNLKDLPEGVKRVKTGLEYIHALSSCSHFLFSGTSGFITNMFTSGCTMIMLSRDWASRNRPVFTEILDRACYIAETEEELITSLVKQPKYGTEMTEYLYGSDRTNVIEKIDNYLARIQ